MVLLLIGMQIRSIYLNPSLVSFSKPQPLDSNKLTDGYNTINVVISTEKIDEIVGVRNLNDSHNLRPGTKLLVQNMYEEKILDINEEYNSPVVQNMHKTVYNLSMNRLRIVDTDYQIGVTDSSERKLIPSLF